MRIGIENILIGTGTSFVVTVGIDRVYDGLGVSEKVAVVSKSQSL